MGNKKPKMSQTSTTIIMNLTIICFLILSTNALKVESQLESQVETLTKGVYNTRGMTCPNNWKMTYVRGVGSDTTVSCCPPGDTAVLDSNTKIIFCCKTGTLLTWLTKRCKQANGTTAKVYTVKPYKGNNAYVRTLGCSSSNFSMNYVSGIKNETGVVCCPTGARPFIHSASNIVYCCGQQRWNHLNLYTRRCKQVNGKTSKVKATQVKVKH